MNLKKTDQTHLICCKTTDSLDRENAAKHFLFFFFFFFLSKACWQVELEKDKDLQKHRKVNEGLNKREADNGLHAESSSGKPERLC